SPREPAGAFCCASSVELGTRQNALIISFRGKMQGKRQLAAEVCSATGFTALFEMLRKRRAITVLNYHRIGDAQATQYDPGVFSATAEEFEWQLAYLKRHFDVATL